MATAKKPTKKNVQKKSVMKSFSIYKNKEPFVSFKITQQTIYWAILLSLVLILFLWILNIQIDTIRAVSNI